VAAIDAARIDLDFHLITRTATLLHTRLQRESDGNWRPITHAFNHDAYTTTLDVGGAPGLDGALPDSQWLSIGDWVIAVDYVIGDPIAWEPTHTHTLR
jgi:hypothetical protein